MTRGLPPAAKPSACLFLLQLIEEPSIRIQPLQRLPYPAHQCRVQGNTSFTVSFALSDRGSSLAEPVLNAFRGGTECKQLLKKLSASRNASSQRGANIELIKHQANIPSSIVKVVADGNARRSELSSCLPPMNSNPITTISTAPLLNVLLPLSKL